MLQKRLNNSKKLQTLFIVCILTGLTISTTHASKDDDKNFENKDKIKNNIKSNKKYKNKQCKATKIDWANLPEEPPIVPVQEKLLYVGTINQGGEEDPDMLLVVGANPSNEEEYAKIIHRMDLPTIGDEVHHFGYNAARTKIILPGLFSNRMHIVNIDNPKKPYVESVYKDLVKDSKYTNPHTVIGLPNGNSLITMLGADTESTAPGGVIEVCGETGEYLRTFGPSAKRNHTVVGPTYMYDAGYKPELNRMITTTFGLPKDVIGPINIAGFGDEVYVWDLKKEKVIQRVKLSPNSGALEVRWLNKHAVPIGYTNAPGSSEIWMWHDLDRDGFYTFEVAISLPAFAAPTDILLSSDDKFLYIANWVGGGGPEAGNIQQWNIENPFEPFLVAQVDTPYAQMMRLSLDNKRLFYGNSLLSGWDDTEFPAGVTRNISYSIRKIDIDHTSGGMALDLNFIVDTSNIQKKNTVGPAGPHQIFFDSDATPAGGFH